MTQLLGGSFDYQKLSDAADQLVKKANADPGLQHVLTTFRPGAPQVTVTVDRDRAETLRVSVGDVFSDADRPISARLTSTSSTNSACRSRSIPRPTRNFA